MYIYSFEFKNVGFEAAGGTLNKTHICIIVYIIIVKHLKSNYQQSLRLY